MIVRRLKKPDTERPYKVTGYPVPTLIFCAICGFLIYSSITFALRVIPKSFIVPASIIIPGRVIHWFTDVRRAGKAA